MADLFQLAKKMKEAGDQGAFSDLCAPGPEPVVFEKRLGFSQLQKLSEKTGTRNVATGRALSASSMKKIFQHPLGYLEYTCKPSLSEPERFYGSHKKAMRMGTMFEDILRSGPVGFSQKYMETDLRITESVRSEAKGKGQFAVSSTESKEVRSMYDSVAESMPEKLELIQGGAHEIEISATGKVWDITLPLRGFADYEYEENGLTVGGDIKTIDSLTKAEGRIYERSYGQYHYWLQAAVYHADRKYDRYEFIFVPKNDSKMIMVVSFDRDQLDKMVQELEEKVLGLFAYHLENGFNTHAPREYRSDFTYQKGKIEIL